MLISTLSTSASPSASASASKRVKSPAEVKSSLCRGGRGCNPLAGEFGLPTSLDLGLDWGRSYGSYRRLRDGDEARVVVDVLGAPGGWTGERSDEGLRREVRAMMRWRTSGS